MDEITKIAAEADSKNVVVEEVKKEPGDKFDSLSNKDALKEAISIHKGDSVETKHEATPTKTEVKAAVEVDSEPPAGFNKEGREAWERKDISGIQKEYKRIHDARTVELNRAQSSEKFFKEKADKEANEAKTWRELGKMAAPYIEARGAEGVPPQTAMMEALALIQEMKKGDPAGVKAELKKIGIDLDKAGTTTTPIVDDSKLTTLQGKVDKLLAKEEEKEFQHTVHSFGIVFDSLASQVTRTGLKVFPDIAETEEGKQLAFEIGSLTKDTVFQKGVLRRFPDADLTVLVREAYKYLGGRVSGEPVTVSPEKDKEHSDKARRAAASTPGRVVARNEQSNLNGKLGNKEAIRAALNHHRGH